jgi:transcriptional regulator with XRE-family HTH domain
MWESGKTKNIRAESLNKAAQRLRVSPDWLLSGADDPPCTKDCGEIAAHWTLLTASQRDKLETMAREWAEENAAVLRELR